MEAPDFDDFTTEELFNHLVDLNQIPFEEDLEDWKFLKGDLLRMCKNTYNNQVYE